MYYSWNTAPQAPVVKSVKHHVHGGAAWASATACRCTETPVGFNTWPQDDRDGRDAGRRGERGLRVRDASPGARWHLHGPAAAGPVPAARRPPAAGPFRRPLPPHEIAGPSFLTSASTSTWTRVRMPASRNACSWPSRRKPPRPSRGSRQPDRRAHHERRPSKFFIADGSWLLVRFSGTGTAGPRGTRRPHPRRSPTRSFRAGEQLVRGA